jgi:DNA-binding NarL/FixJ family response regulator
VVIDSCREVEIATRQHVESDRIANASAATADSNRRPIHDALRRATSDVQLLSARQLDVLQLLADGLGNKAIAQQLGISEATTKQCVTAILLKLRLSSRLQAGLVGLLALRIGADALQTKVCSPNSPYESIAD